MNLRVFITGHGHSSFYITIYIHRDVFRSLLYIVCSYHGVVNKHVGVVGLEIHNRVGTMTNTSGEVYSYFRGIHVFGIYSLLFCCFFFYLHIDVFTT